MLDPGYSMEPGDALPESEADRALPWFAQRLAADDRFAQKTVRTLFRGFTGITDTAAATKEYLRLLKENFQQSGSKLRVLVRDIHLSPYFLGENLADELDPNQFADVGAGRKLTPEELHRKIGSVLGDGYEWTGPESRGGLMDDHRLLFGGIDSRYVLERSADPSSMTNGIELRIANQVSCERVAFHLLNGGLLFPIATASDVPEDVQGEDRIRRNIQYLHRHLLGEDLTIASAEVDATYQLFLDVRALGETAIPAACRGGGAGTDENGTIIPWISVVSFLMSDYRFVYH